MVRLKVSRGVAYLMLRGWPTVFSKAKLLGLVLLAVAAAILAAGCSFSGKEAAASPSTPMLKLDPIVVNLAEPGRYVKVTSVFSFYSAAEEKAAEAETAKLRDAVISTLRKKTTGEMVDTASLKKDLLDAANRALRPAEAAGLYFEELLIQ